LDTHQKLHSLYKKLPNTEPISIPPEYASFELTPCPQTKLEREFSRQFPGRTQTYQHNQGLLVLREVQGATRKLHNTSTCLRASGFNISLPQLMRDERGRVWTTYHARNKKNNLTVKSTIMNQTGKSWSSSEEWFWDAFFASPTETYLSISDIRETSRY